MKRRGFIKNSSLGSIMLALHPESCFATTKDQSSTKPKKDKVRIDLIKNIRLLTHISLEEMKVFYVGKMGLSVLGESKNEITFNAGNSTLTFVKIDDSTEQPWYHFAFNIPENKILKARVWQLNRTALIPTPQRLRDSNFPNDVRHFRNWNAHSIFFYDPAGNLLEFIARHDLENGASGDFSSDDIQNISEIAFVVDDQQDEAHRLGNEFDLPVYPKTTNFWWSMGDENGLLLCIPKRIFGENTANPKKFGVHRTEATIGGAFDKEYLFDNFPYKVVMKNESTE